MGLTENAFLYGKVRRGKAGGYFGRILVRKDRVGVTLSAFL